MLTRIVLLLALATPTYAAERLFSAEVAAESAWGSGFLPSLTGYYWFNSQDGSEWTRMVGSITNDTLTYEGVTYTVTGIYLFTQQSGNKFLTLLFNDGRPPGAPVAPIRPRAGAPLVFRVKGVDYPIPGKDSSLLFPSGFGWYATNFSLADGETVSVELWDVSEPEEPPLVEIEPAPKLESAVANGSQLLLEFTGEFDESHVPEPDVFTVTADGEGVGVGAVEVDEATVTLTLTAPIIAGQTVLLSYVQSPDGLRNEEGNRTGEFHNVAVRNATTVGVTAAGVVDRESLRAFVERAATVGAGQGYDFFDRTFRQREWRDGPIYLYILRTDGLTIFHGFRREREGQNNINNPDSTGKLYIPELIATAQAGGGFVEYYFDNPEVQGDEEDGSFKVAYVTMLDDMVIGAGIYPPQATPALPLVGVGLLSLLLIAGGRRWYSTK